MAAVDEKTSASASSGAGPSPRRHNPLPIIVIVLLVVAVSVYFIFFANKTQAPTNEIEASGRIEGYEVNIGAKIAGRVDSVTHREGEAVKKGELLAQISDDDIQAQLRGCEARIQKTEEQVESSRDKIEVIRSQIHEADLRIRQVGEDSGGKIDQMESMVSMNRARVAQSKSDLLQAQADARLAKIRKERYDFLASKEAVTRDEADQVATGFETANALVASREANIQAAERELRASVGQLNQARSTRHGPAIETAQKSALEKQLAQSEHELKQAEHEVANARAERDQIVANIAYLKLLSPIDGVVTARTVEPGAVVVPGQTVISLIDLNKVYLRAYVPEGQVGRIRLGQKAKVFLDSSPDKAFEGKISQVDPQGSFTPENIYFKNDRVKQVFGIKVEIDQPGGFAKPGMPADAKLVLD